MHARWEEAMAKKEGKVTMALDVNYIASCLWGQGGR